MSFGEQVANPEKSVSLVDSQTYLPTANISWNKHLASFLFVCLFLLLIDLLLFLDLLVIFIA